MADRKQTPDVLGEILGGEPTAPQPASAPKPRTARQRKPSAQASRRRSGPRQPQWEYMEVIFRDYGGYRARYINGEEQQGWKEAPIIYEYLNQLGADGWELVGVGSREKNQMPAYFRRRKA